MIYTSDSKIISKKKVKEYQYLNCKFDIFELRTRRNTYSLAVCSICGDEYFADCEKDVIDKITKNQDDNE